MVAARHELKHRLTSVSESLPSPIRFASVLTKRGLSVAIMPRDSFFMKPLVTAIIAALSP